MVEFCASKAHVDGTQYGLHSGSGVVDMLFDDWEAGQCLRDYSWEMYRTRFGRKMKSYFYVNLLTQ